MFPSNGEFEGPDITFQSPELDLWSLLQSDHGWSKFARPSPKLDLWKLVQRELGGGGAPQFPQVSWDSEVVFCFF